MIDLNKNSTFSRLNSTTRLFLWSEAMICYSRQTFGALASCVFIATSHIRNELVCAVLRVQVGHVTGCESSRCRPLNTEERESVVPLLKCSVVCLATADGLGEQLLWSVNTRKVQHKQIYDCSLFGVCVCVCFLLLHDNKGVTKQSCDTSILAWCAAGFFLLISCKYLTAAGENCDWPRETVSDVQCSHGCTLSLCYQNVQYSRSAW